MDCKIVKFVYDDNNGGCISDEVIREKTPLSEIDGVIQRLTTKEELDWVQEDPARRYIRYEIYPL